MSAQALGFADSEIATTQPLLDFCRQKLHTPDPPQSTRFNAQAQLAVVLGAVSSDNPSAKLSYQARCYPLCRSPPPRASSRRSMLTPESHVDCEEG
jgi:hypothetical protein